MCKNYLINLAKLCSPRTSYITPFKLKAFFVADFVANTNTPIYIYINECIKIHGYNVIN